MKLRIAVSVALAIALCGCTVQQTGKRGSIKQVDQQKVLANHIDLAFRYISNGNRDLARNHLEKARELDASRSGIYTAYALIYEAEGEEALAEENFRQAIRYDANDTRSKFYYGVFLLSHNRPQEARTQFKQVTENVDYANRALALLSLGRTELQLGNTADARVAFEKALRINQRFAPVYLELADMEYVAGNVAAAKRYLGQYHQLARSSAHSLWLGVRLEHHFRNKDAEASYGLALKNLYPNSKENLAYQEWLKHARE